MNYILYLKSGRKIKIPAEYFKQFVNQESVTGIYQSFRDNNKVIFGFKINEIECYCIEDIENEFIIKDNYYTASLDTTSGTIFNNNNTSTFLNKKINK